MSSGVLLGGTKPQLEIIVPHGYEDRKVVVGRCVVPDAKGKPCGATFYRGQEEDWQKHVVRCAQAKLDGIRAQAPSEVNKDTIFGDRDLDLERHFRGVADNMRREGRWDVKPSERTST